MAAAILAITILFMFLFTQFGSKENFTEYCYWRNFWRFTPCNWLA
jgi:hypothetical protein